MLSSGTLFIVATPIGNLEDISARALRTLRETDRIACEDTRHTRKLLDHYGIDRPLLSFHEHNERDRTAELLERLRAGERIALVSDAGTPLISDPGYRIVEAAAREGFTVVTIPGPSAVVAALAASGLPTDSFYFGGFLPPKQSQRRRLLERLADLDCVLIFYEAPHRLLEALEDVNASLPGRDVVVARELTKLHEEFVRGATADVLEQFRARQAVKGEITLLIGKAPEVSVDSATAPAVFRKHLAAGLSRMDAMKATAKDCGMSKREVYKVIEESNA